MSDTTKHLRERAQRAHARDDHRLADLLMVAAAELDEHERQTGQGKLNSAPAHHVIVWEFDHDQTRARLRCRAPEGAHCRLTGPEHCECESWTIEHADMPGAAPFHRVETYGEADIIHWMHDSGVCQVEPFWYCNDLHECATPGQQFTIGEVPVSLSWEDPGYSWTREVDSDGGQ